MIYTALDKYYLFSISRSLADYYDIITSPIDLLKIQQKLKTEEYVDVNQFSSDIELMVNNAKTYYKVIILLFINY